MVAKYCCGRPAENAVNDAIHQLLQGMRQAVTWAPGAFEGLWIWPWNQIGSIFNFN
jgi:hypothetical protein